MKVNRLAHCQGDDIIKAAHRTLNFYFVLTHRIGLATDAEDKKEIALAWNILDKFQVKHGDE